MKKRYLIAIVIAGIILIVISAIHFFERPKSGDVAPPFTLKDISGKEISLESEKGKIVFLNFWSTWCGVCLSEVPTIEKLYEEFKGRDVEVLTVLVDDDGRNLKDIKKKMVLNYPVATDPEGKTADSYQVWGVPESFIIGRDGVILERSPAAINYSKMKRSLEDYLAR